MDQALIAMDFHPQDYASSSMRGLLVCSTLCEKVAHGKCADCTVFLDFFRSGNSYQICIVCDR